MYIYNIYIYIYKYIKLKKLLKVYEEMGKTKKYTFIKSKPIFRYSLCYFVYM